MDNIRIHLAIETKYKRKQFKFQLSIFTRLHKSHKELRKHEAVKSPR